MLARAAARRRRAGRAAIAISRAVSPSATSAATVHVLDDGFQHFRAGAGRRSAGRVAEDDLDGAGRCRPAGCASRSTRSPRADARHRARRARRRGGWRVGRAGLARDDGVSDAARLRRAVGRAGRACLRRPVVAVAGIARPERFFADLRAAGWELAGALAFRDHHRFTPRDVARIVGAARDSRRGRS